MISVTGRAHGGTDSAAVLFNGLQLTQYELPTVGTDPALDGFRIVKLLAANAALDHREQPSA